MGVPNLMTILEIEAWQFRNYSSLLWGWFIKSETDKFFSINELLWV